MTRKIKPNIVFIMSDTHRRDAMGCYGNRIIKTPNLNELAGNGVKFANAYVVTPLCMPSRNSIITGLYTHQHGIYGNLCPPLREEHRKNTFPNKLKETGYRTAFIGRHHFLDY